MSLLDKARQAPRGSKRPVNWEEIELAIAFFRGEVTCAQAAAASGVVHDRNYYCKAFSRLRQAVIQGLVSIEVVK